LFFCLSIVGLENSEHIAAMGKFRE
jgi:hypothetical protein